MTAAGWGLVSELGHKPGQVCMSLKGGSCCLQMVREQGSCVLDEWMCVSSRLSSLLFLPRANTPKVNFGASTATATPGITGGFSFGAPAATSTPSSQAAAPSGFAFGSAGPSSTSTAPSGSTGGFTFSSGSTAQAGAAGFSLGPAAPQATSAGLTFGTAPAAAATTSTATLGAATPSAAPFSLGGQPTGGGEGWGAAGGWEPLAGAQLGVEWSSAASASCWGRTGPGAGARGVCDRLCRVCSAGQTLLFRL